MPFSHCHCDLKHVPTTSLTKQLPNRNNCTVITGPWSPSIGLVTDPWRSIMSSLVNVRLKMGLRMCTNHELRQKLPNHDSCDHRTVTSINRHGHWIDGETKAKNEFVMRCRIWFGVVWLHNMFLQYFDVGTKVTWEGETNSQINGETRVTGEVETILHFDGNLLPVWYRPSVFYKKPEFTVTFIRFYSNKSLR